MTSRYVASNKNIRKVLGRNDYTQHSCTTQLRMPWLVHIVRLVYNTMHKRLMQETQVYCYEHLSLGMFYSPHNMHYIVLQISLDPAHGCAIVMASSILFLGSSICTLVCLLFDELSVAIPIQIHF